MVDCTSPALSPLTPDARAALHTVRSGFVSLGHAGGQYNASVRVNAIGARSRAAAGALWVAEHKRAADDAPGPVLAMERRAATRDPSHVEWCYAVAEPDGTLLRSGALADCAGCHSAAPSDSVFTTGSE